MEFNDRFLSGDLALLSSSLCLCISAAVSSSTPCRPSTYLAKFSSMLTINFSTRDLFVIPREHDAIVSSGMRFISSRSSGLYSTTFSCVSTSIPSAKSVLRSMAARTSGRLAESIYACSGPAAGTGASCTVGPASGGPCPLRSAAVPHSGQNSCRTFNGLPQPVQKRHRLEFALFL